VLEVFSPQRLSYGSDWPMCLLATAYGEWLGLVHDWLGALSQHEQNRILGGTASEACGLWRLSEHHAARLHTEGSFRA
jgi:L-fuconolactonase